jgi:hypothetical protein
MTRPQVLIVRPEPSRGLGAFYRNLGLTMLATYAQNHGLQPRLVDMTFDSLDAALADGPRVAATDAFDVVGVGDCLPDAMPVIAGLARGGRAPAQRMLGTGAGPARLDALSPDYSIWPEDRYFPVFPVEFSRGCRQHCPFCTDPVLRRGLAVDPVERTLRTLHRLVAEYGRVWVRFVDSSMSSLGLELERLLAALTAADLPIEWSAYAYPHDITTDLAGRMARAGCRALFLGIESLAQGVRVGKHHTKRPEEVARAVDALHDHGIFVHGNFIVGLPGETAATIEETLTGLGKIRFDSVGGGPFFLTPGSTFERRPASFGIRILDPGWPARQHVNFFDPEHEYFATATLSQGQMKQLAAEFRQRVQAEQLGCWNLSDYALLCWLSVGGRPDELVRLWQQPSDRLGAEEQMVLDVLKEKSGVAVPAQAASFVATTRRLTTARHVVATG